MNASASPHRTPSRAGFEHDLLITAGPTHEPIDAVRYIANRSSGRLGIALADAAVARGLSVLLLLGPTHLTPADPRVQTLRFQSAADLQRLLKRHFRKSRTLVMAAAVADYTPITPPAARSGKLRRSASGLVLRLRPTPDLLAGVAAARRQEQTVVGFALEPASRLLRSAREKLRRKSLDAIVANELRTMDSPTISATLILADGTTQATPKSMPKADFVRWLLDRLPDARATRPLP